jgi:hypothetical protein
MFPSGTATAAALAGARSLQEVGDIQVIVLLEDDRTPTARGHLERLPGVLSVRAARRTGGGGRRIRVLRLRRTALLSGRGCAGPSSRG